MFDFFAKAMNPATYTDAEKLAELTQAFDPSKMAFDGFSGATPLSTDLHKAAWEQGEKVVALQEKMVKLQLEQVKAASALGHQQLQAVAKLQAEALESGVHAMLDAEKSMVELMKPAEA